MSLLQVQVDSGKYELTQNNDGSVSVKRHGKDWRDVTGDNLILALAYEIDHLRKGLKILKIAVNDKQLDKGATNFILQLLRE